MSRSTLGVGAPAMAPHAPPRNWAAYHAVAPLTAEKSPVTTTVPSVAMARPVIWLLNAAPASVHAVPSKRARDRKGPPSMRNVPTAHSAPSGATSIRVGSVLKTPGSFTHAFPTRRATPGDPRSGPVRKRLDA